MSRRKAKFRRGQVVSVRCFYGNFSACHTGPGFAGKRGWRHGFQFGKIVKINPPLAKYPEQPFSYFLDGWMSAQVEDDLRSLGKAEIGGGNV